MDMNKNTKAKIFPRRKAQVSFEFMISIMMGLFVVLTLLVLFSNKLHDVMEDNKSQQVDAILGIIDDEVTFAKGAMTGYTRTFELPVTIEGQNYSLNLTDGTVYISYLGQDYSRGFSHKVNGSICLAEVNETTRSFAVQRFATEVTLSPCPDCVPNFANCTWYDTRGTCDTLGDLKQECRDRYCLCE
ncbi:hypothetical protein HZA99_06115 [Candidatus Woesearchaeota archaeon]|nr:hypothetical protein [Candidatus Woesearchaeota archaeon]